MPGTPNEFTIFDAIDQQIATLGRGLGALRLSLGEGLLRLSNGHIQDLGFPTFDSYAREALGRSGRWASDVRALARRLATLPHLRAALVSGHLSTSMVELVARIATPVDDAEWVERSAAMNVRQMRAELKSRALDVFDDTAPARVAITVQVDRVDAWAFEQARMLVEAVGARRGDEAVEAMLAEGLGELLARDPDIDLPATIAGSHDDERAWRLELAAIRERAEGAVDAILPKEVVTYTPLPEVVWETDVRGLDRQLREVAATLARRDVELGALACEVIDHEIWRVFGYASVDHYCRERIGLAPSSVTTRVALARRLAGVPEVREALVHGRIGYEAAALVARVAGPQSVHAWIERATLRTVKQLREEVDVIETLARVADRRASSYAPPESEAVDEVHAIERAVIGVVSGVDAGRDEQMSGGTGEAALGVGTTQPTTLRLSLSEGTGQFWRALERLHSQMSGEGFVPFLVRAVLKSWRDVGDGAVAYADVYLRDRWRCASPICTSRNVTPHHVRFRSHGGGEEQGNLVSLCEKCHLELVHGGKLRVTGVAPQRLRWEALGWAA